MTDPHYTDDRVTIWHGDCRTRLAELPENSIDAVVTDPPYEIGFMGVDHDSTGVAFDPTTWAAVLRVLKPGGHLVAFGATRSWHRMVCAIEDAGFDIRDQILCWAAGQGFPKGQTVSKAIDAAAGVEQPVVGTKLGQPGYSLADNGRTNQVYGDLHNPEAEAAITAAVTADAQRFIGYNTSLKPSVEPICLARKPLDGTIVQNVLTHGTGGLNIDATRVASATPVQQAAGGLDDSPIFGSSVKRYEPGTGREYTNRGRWPANLVLVHNPGCRPAGTRTVKTGPVGGHPIRDSGTALGIETWVCEPGCPVAAIDQQSGQSSSPLGMVRGQSRSGGIMGSADGHHETETGYGDTGGASRFFATFSQALDEDLLGDESPVRYVAKAPGKERPWYVDANGDRVAHSTVKPLSLIRYLVKLLAPPTNSDGSKPVILDPFAGSGTTAEACVLEGVRFVGVELTGAYLPLIEQRIARGYRGGPDYPDPVERPPADSDAPTLF